MGYQYSERPDGKGGIVLGLIGLPCSGKSTVRRFLEELGARAVDADQIVRSLYDDEEVKREVIALLGAEVLDETGRIDRSRVARLVFADRSLLEDLVRKIIYPRTGEILGREIEEFRRTARPGDVLVLDAPTLVESGRAAWADRILWVEAPDERRLQWAAQRGWDEAELRRRDAAMLPPEQKRPLAHYVIVNRGSLDELREQVNSIWSRLQGELQEGGNSAQG